MRDFNTFLTGIAVGVALTAPVLFYILAKKRSTEDNDVEYINPKGLSNPVGYSHIAVKNISSTQKYVTIAGQASLDKDKENVVTNIGDLEQQANNAYENLGVALRAVGGRPQDVLKSDIYTTANSFEDIEIIVAARQRFFKDCKSAPPGALQGVPFLALEELEVEVDATAIVARN